MQSNFCNNVKLPVALFELPVPVVTEVSCSSKLGISTGTGVDSDKKWSAALSTISISAEAAIEIGLVSFALSKDAPVDLLKLLEVLAWSDWYQESFCNVTSCAFCVMSESKVGLKAADCRCLCLLHFCWRLNCEKTFYFQMTLFSLGFVAIVYKLQKLAYHT